MLKFYRASALLPGSSWPSFILPVIAFLATVICSARSLKGEVELLLRKLQWQGQEVFLLQKYPD
jgi:hypothetical protein